MQIGETIRNYRKEKKLTQEQMAQMLGVSTPAVNKWENGVSYPDITLLAPIARLLDIRLETLLCFEQDLSEQEVNQKSEKLAGLMTKDGYDHAFSYAKEQIKEYPNCDKLILTFAKVLQAYPAMGVAGDTERNEEYQQQIQEWYQRLTQSQDRGIADSANASLAGLAMNQKDYEKAQECLDCIPDKGFDKRIMQAGLYERQGKMEEAYGLYEKVIYSQYLDFSMAMQLLSVMYCKDGKPQQGKELALMSQSIAEAMKLGEFQSISPIFTYAGTVKDADLTISCIKKLFHGIEHMVDYLDTILFAHWTTTTKSEQEQTKNRFLIEYKKIFQNALHQDGEMAYLKESPAYEDLVKMLKDQENAG